MFSNIFIDRPRFAIVIAILFFAGAASTLAWFPREAGAAAGEPSASTAPLPTQDQRSEFERWYASQPRVPLVVPPDGAKVLVVKFNDFQCPACGQSYLQYKPIFAKFEAEQPGAVKLVLRGVVQLLGPIPGTPARERIEQIPGSS